MGWRSRNPLARAAHELAKLDTLAATQDTSEGRTVAVFIGYRDGQARRTSTLTREHSA